MTYVPVTHEAPPICVEYEKVPEAVTVCVEQSTGSEGTQECHVDEDAVWERWGWTDCPRDCVALRANEATRPRTGS